MYELVKGGDFIKTDSPKGVLYRFRCNIIQVENQKRNVIVSETGSTQEETDERARVALIQLGWSKEEADSFVVSDNNDNI